MSAICVTSYKSSYLPFIFQRLFLFIFFLSTPLVFRFPQACLNQPIDCSLLWNIFSNLAVPKSAMIVGCVFPSALHTEYILCQMLLEHIH